MSDSDALLPLRDEIDRLDQEIQSLIEKRAKCALQVAEVKQAQSAPGEELVFYRPEREAAILNRVKARNKGPLPDKEVAQVFRAIISSCLALEKPLEVAYLGPEGTFTQAATMRHFGHAVRCQPMQTIAQVFSQVENKECNYGVVPVENSTEGMVSHTLDNFMASNLTICGEVEMPIQLHLMTQPGADFNKVTRICAHQQALAQCRSWLESHHPNVDVVAVSSNGEAAKIALHDASIAAVAGDIAQQQYALEKVASNIQDRVENSTRFLVVGRDKVPFHDGVDFKTSLIISTHNEAGALFRLLESFEKEGVNLTRIDTRPSKTQNWAYVFFIEFEGHSDQPIIQQVLARLKEQSLMLKALGSYPRAVI